MIIKHGDRGIGKTTTLIKKSNINQYPIICLDIGRAKNIKIMAQKLNIIIPEPILVSQLPIGVNENIEKVLIDDIDDVLFKLINRDVSEATTTFTTMEEIDGNNFN